MLKEVVISNTWLGYISNNYIYLVFRFCKVL